MRLLPHEGYWGGPQKTTQLIFAISREPAVRVQKMAAGECHITAPLRDIDIAALDKRSEVTILKKQALNISYLAFNLKKAPTDKRSVREALDIAIDRDALFKVLFPRGDAMQAVSAFPPAIAGYNAELKNEFNPERAKLLLAEAGLADKLEIDLWALPIARPTNPNGMLMAQMIQQDWAKHRRQGHHQDLRVGRVPEARQQRRAPCLHERLVGRHRRGRRLPRAQPDLRRQPRRHQVLQRGVRQARRAGPRDRRCRPAQRDLPRSASDLQARAAVDHDGAFEPSTSRCART